MPFIIERREDSRFPMFLVQEPDGELAWDARQREATRFDGDQAESIAEELNMHASIKAVVVGVRNITESAT